MIPLAFRTLARVTVNSPMSGTEYVTLTLVGPHGDEEIPNVRMVRFPREVIKRRRDGIQIYDTEEMVSFRGDLVDCTRTRDVPEGSFVTLADGTVRQLLNPVRNMGEYRATLIDPQDPPED